MTFDIVDMVIKVTTFVVSIAAMVVAWFGGRHRDIDAALLQNPCLKRGSPFPLGRQATGTISAVPSAEKRFIRAMRMWISAVCRSGSLALMRSPKALRQRIFASTRLRAWYPVHRFQNALP